MKRQLYGLTEIHEELGDDVAKLNTLYSWFKRGKLPPPTELLAQGPVWRAVVIEDWIEGQKARKRGGEK